MRAVITLLVESIQTISTWHHSGSVFEGSLLHLLTVSFDSFDSGLGFWTFRKVLTVNVRVGVSSRLETSSLQLTTVSNFKFRSQQLYGSRLVWKSNFSSALENSTLHYSMYGNQNFRVLK